MRFKHLLPLVAFALVACASAVHAQEQQKDQQVVDDFITTRGVSFDEPTRKAQTQKQATRPAAPRRNNSASTKGANANPTAGGVASNKSSTGKSNAPAKPAKGEGARPVKGSESAAQAGAESEGAQTLKASAAVGGPPRPIALGYTILMKDDAGSLSFVDASREFKTGDHIVIALETNADGYLYMFSASNGKDPELLFPNARIDEGGNALQAHARATFPTGTDADQPYFINITDPPATEHLFIVFSRQPLAGVPTGEPLVKFCGKNLDDCSWKPTAAQWERIKGEAKGRGVTEAKNTQLAQAGPPPVMPNILQRGLKIKRDDPAPAIVRVNDSPEASVLVTEIVLIHK
jgi:hypothetical protein